MCGVCDVAHANKQNLQTCGQGLYITILYKLLPFKITTTYTYVYPTCNKVKNICFLLQESDEYLIHLEHTSNVIRTKVVPLAHANIVAFKYSNKT